MKTTLLYPASVITETLRFLQASGQKSCEGIVLWLGGREGSNINIKVVYEPAHRAEADVFHIPPNSMLQLKEYLRKNRLFIAAQVHSHPSEAFHSRADDQWAIVRHAGALSIVLPRFALQTTPATFFDHAATFKLSETNRWEQLSNQMAGELCKIAH